jgi:pyruvate dehydrogenase E2 component (dihydrolipoamide acetyltransferase)
VSPIAVPGEQVPLSQMRKAIARRMTEAKQTVPHFYLTSEIDMGPASELRQQLNQAAGGAVKISVNDLIIKACAAALVAHPRINAMFEGDHLVVPSSIHIGFAAAIEDGLITPTLRDCQTKSIGQIAKEARELAERAAAKKLKPEEFSGATFTVSNLGMYGIVEFVAIINPPQAAILAVGAVREIPVVVEGQLAVGKRMRVTLSCDHRVIDGAQGAQFLATLREILENPLRLVL